MPDIDLAPLPSPYSYVHFLISGVPEEYKEYTFCDEYKEFARCFKPGAESKADETPNYHEIREAVSIYKSLGKRIAVNSFILVGCSLEEIAELFSIPYIILEMYNRYVFKTDKLKNKLDIAEFINTLTDEEATAYRHAMAHGKDYLKWTLCGVPIQGNSSVKESLQELFTLTKVKAMSSANSGITREESKESLRWILGAARLAQTLMKIDQDESERSQKVEDREKATRELFQTLVSMKTEDDVKNISALDETTIV